MGTASVAERVAIVTGATSGIGREIARGLAMRRYRTVVVGRGAERARAVAEELGRSTGNPRVESMSVGDLGLRAETHALGVELARRYPAVHLLVNNAGAYFARREVAADGLERTFALNVLAPLSLTLDLAASLRAGAPSRVVNVSSSAHEGARVEIDDLEGKSKYRGFTAYSRSKLELNLLTRELARRFAGTGVTVNAVHPGFVASGFGMNNRGGARAVIWVLSRLFGKRPRSGASTPLAAAMDPRFGNVSGAYISRGEVEPGSPESRDPEVGARLYNVCLGYLSAPGLPDPSGAAR